MKVLNAVVATSMLAFVAVAAAQGPGQGRPPMGGPGGRPGGMGGGRGRMDPTQQTAMMTQMLGLNAAQQAKIKAILTKGAADMKKMRDAQTAAIKKVLTPDQLKKMASMPRGGGMGGGMRGGPPGGMRGGR